MSNPYIKSSQYTCWSNQQDAVKQPNGIDYSSLEKSMEKSAGSKKYSPARRDLRKKSFVNDEKLVKEDNSLDNIDKESIIPVPGLLIEQENSESDTKPPESDWIAPHGQQWGPMTL